MANHQHAEKPPEAIERLPLPPGDSREQREAEAIMVAALSEQLGLPLMPARVVLPGGGRLEVDAVNEEVGVYCEAWAHQGPPKSAQRTKVITDAFKLAFLARLRGGNPRLVLLFSDAAAAKPFLGKSWYAEAIRTLGIAIEVIELPAAVREGLVQAQKRQYR
jgi:hypothetical protein